MTEFKQIIGRGTRLREKDGKTHFVIMDFRGVTRLFADPEWDGPIEIDPDYDPDAETNGGSGGGPGGEVGGKYIPIVDENGCSVEIINKTVSVYDSNGKLLKQESIIDYTKTNITGEYASLDQFIQRWTAEEKKEVIQSMLRAKGIDLELMKVEEGMTDVDDFDFICHVAYDQKPLTRKERAEGVKRNDFLSQYSGVAREVLETLIDKYKDFL